MRSLTSLSFFLPVIFIIISCGNYSFSGKSIPPGIKNTQLLLFEDNSGRYDLSLPEVLYEKITGYISHYNYFEIENSAVSDSKIYGTVKSYSERISSQTRDEVADQMEMTLSVEVSFFNNLNSEYIVKNLRISESEYFKASGGDDARNEAFAVLTDRIAEKIILGLSSNW